MGICFGEFSRGAHWQQKIKKPPMRKVFVLCHRRERAAVYGKLLKLRDTDGFRKQFQ